MRFTFIGLLGMAADYFPTVEVVEYGATSWTYAVN
jgi:hypothetical protein